MYRKRLEHLRELMSKKNLESLILTDLSNIFYISGFTGSTAVVVVSEDQCTILVDSRYTLQAGSQCPEAMVVEFRGKSQMRALGELISEIHTGSTGYEADCMSVASLRELRRHTESGIVLKSAPGLAQRLRMVKDDTELALIREAARITDAAVNHIERFIKPGQTEKDIEVELLAEMRRQGADKEAFDCIVASGPNAACPHASPTDAVVLNDSFVKMDFGARYKYYNADITRTLPVGNPPAPFRDIYKIVLEAQLQAISAIKPGMKGCEIDAVAREYITSKGYGHNFGHGLGHSLGIDVHDGPGFSMSSGIILEPGMVITVEPGIYVESWGGIRIEDDIVVTEDGCEVLTHALK